MIKDLQSLCALAVMALGHILIWKVQSYSVTRTQRWLSFGAGASVAYVFVHVLPEIGIFQQKLMGYAGHNPHGGFLSNHLYLAALGGIFLLYFLDFLENRFEYKESHTLTKNTHFTRVSFIKLLLYFLYNVLVAYMITQRPGDGIINLILITFGLTLHFIVFNLRIAELYGELYHKYICWIISAGLILGWVVGITVNIPLVIEVTLFSVIGGIITYIALKVECSHTENRAPFHFMAGVLLYTLIILAAPYFGH